MRLVCESLVFEFLKILFWFPWILHRILAAMAGGMRPLIKSHDFLPKTLKLTLSKTCLRVLQFLRNSIPSWRCWGRGIHPEFRKYFSESQRAAKGGSGKGPRQKSQKA